jgi:endonuclease/exonuclease/phosphatase (EEP) superfamily protein YafD
MDLSLTFLQPILLAAAASATVLTLAGFFGAGSGLCDYAAHFRPHIAAGALLLAVVAMLFGGHQRGLPLAAVLVAAAVVNIAVMLAESRFRALAQASGAGTTLRIASTNLLFFNTDYARGLQWIREEQPDVLFLTEVTDGWADAIESLADLYPYRAVRPTGWMAMVARRPWTSVEVAKGPRPRQGMLVARFDLGGTPMTVIGAHPASPQNLHLTAVRNAEIDVIAGLARAAPGPVAAMGDFNATPWSAPLRRLVRSSPLRYTDIAATTWPTSIPRWLGIKIDHILIGNGCGLVDYRAGPNIGSDHRPVVATIRCRARDAAAP